MKYEDIKLGDKVEIYKNMEWGLVEVVGKSPPETIIIEQKNGKRHFTPCGKIKRPKPLMPNTDKIQKIREAQ